MPTYWTRTLIPTTRQVPTEAVAPSHQLMLRAGLIRQIGAGIYDYLPLGLRALQKTMAIVREEMNAAGAVEVLMPTLHPIELWERTGRRADYGENLFVVKDRHGREQALGPTHEEVFTEAMAAYTESYKQLPITLYQIQTKFRDEYRPRFGVIRSREFIMKDAYSFDTTLEGLDVSYQAMYDAYQRIFTRAGVPFRIVEAESGPIGGSASHEFMIPSPTGEDTILESDKGNYAANVEKCEIGERAISETLAPFSGGACTALAPEEPTGELEKVHTPDASSIEAVGKLMKVKPKNLLKTMVYCATSVDDDSDPRKAEDPWYVIAVVRGDHDVNESKLGSQVDAIFGKAMAVNAAPEDLAREDGFAIGFVGPHVFVGRDDAYLIIDADAAADQFWASGANEVDHHAKHFNWHRDVIAQVADDFKRRMAVADIRNAMDGDPAPAEKGGGTLRETKGIEVGHVFKLGTKYTDSMDFTVSGDDGGKRKVLMGCYGIGVNRILAGAIERAEPGCEGHDDNGIIWPAAIAPYQVLITPIKYDGEMKEAADRLAGELESKRSPVGPLAFYHPDVLIDDRAERPGVKFKDADLVGIPVRITIGDKGLKDGCVEIKARRADKAEMVKLEDAADHVIELLAQG